MAKHTPKSIQRRAARLLHLRNDTRGSACCSHDVRERLERTRSLSVRWRGFVVGSLARRLSLVLPRKRSLGVRNDRRRRWRSDGRPLFKGRRWRKRRKTRRAGLGYRGLVGAGIAVGQGVERRERRRTRRRRTRRR